MLHWVGTARGPLDSISLLPGQAEFLDVIVVQDDQITEIDEHGTQRENLWFQLAPQDPVPRGIITEAVFDRQRLGIIIAAEGAKGVFCELELPGSSDSISIDAEQHVQVRFRRLRRPISPLQTPERIAAGGTVTIDGRARRSRSVGAGA